MKWKSICATLVLLLMAMMLPAWAAENVRLAQLPQQLDVSRAKIGAYSGEMVRIPAGTFRMGNNGNEPYTRPNEVPQHTVTLAAYYIGKYEVTRGDYRKFIAAGGYGNAAYWSTAGWKWKTALNRKEPVYWTAKTCFLHIQGECSVETCSRAFTQTDRHPVVGVSYYEAEAFCKWAGGRLPTEAEWEKAARWAQRHARVYPWGDSWDVQKCNNAGDSLLPMYQTAPVGSYPSGVSPYGLHDMAGNVSEWVGDWYQPDYYSRTPSGGWINPTGPRAGVCRVFRGGSWQNTSNECRCAFRRDFTPDSTWHYIGFRFARSGR